MSCPRGHPTVHIPLRKRELSYGLRVLPPNYLKSSYHLEGALQTRCGISPPPLNLTGYQSKGRKLQKFTRGSKKSTFFNPVGTPTLFTDLGGGLRRQAHAASQSCCQPRLRALLLPVFLLNFIAGTSQAFTIISRKGLWIPRNLLRKLLSATSGNALSEPRKMLRFII